MSARASAKVHGLDAALSVLCHPLWPNKPIDRDRATSYFPFVSLIPQSDSNHGATATMLATGPASPYSCHLCGGVNSKLPVIQSHGMGVESTAITLRWLNEPSSRNFCLCQLIIITAQTGDEHTNDTGPLVEQYLLPLYRQHNIRFVEVARAGPREADGIVVLQDTRSPQRLHLEGAYKLSDELLLNGTVPQSGGVHTCALKFKAFVVEYWLKHFLRTPFHQVFGYNSEEFSRAASATLSDAKRNAKDLRVAFGFNVDEPDRAARAVECDGQVTMAFGYSAGEEGRASRTISHDPALKRHSFFPLIDWQWTREMCLDYIRQCLSVIWLRSCCGLCPFSSALSRGTPEGLQRLLNHPEQAVRALLIEHVSTAMNPRATLFSRKSLRSILRKAPEFAVVFTAYEQKISDLSWSIYRVRRIYSKKGKADRCIEVLETGSRSGITAVFAGYSGQARRLETIEGITYAYLCERGEQYPAFEEYYVAAPAMAHTKARYGVPWFDGKWASLMLQQPLVTDLPELEA